MPANDRIEALLWLRNHLELDRADFCKLLEIRRRSLEPWEQRVRSISNVSWKWIRHIIKCKRIGPKDFRKDVQQIP